MNISEYCNANSVIVITKDITHGSDVPYGTITGYPTEESDLMNLELNDIRHVEGDVSYSVDSSAEIGVYYLDITNEILDGIFSPEDCGEAKDKIRIRVLRSSLKRENPPYTEDLPKSLRFASVKRKICPNPSVLPP